MLEAAIGAGVAIVLGAVGGGIWAVRLEGRINGHDQLFEERDTQDKLRVAMADERHRDVKERLERIERKLDTLRDTHV